MASVRGCPRNPLAVYMLGRTYERLGEAVPAQRQFQAAYNLYKSFGWTPPTVASAMRSRKPATPIPGTRPPS
jgi:hypothetical protein